MAAWANRNCLHWNSSFSKRRYHSIDRPRLLRTWLQNQTDCTESQATKECERPVNSMEELRRERSLSLITQNDASFFFSKTSREDIQIETRVSASRILFMFSQDKSVSFVTFETAEKLLASHRRRLLLYEIFRSLNSVAQFSLSPFSNKSAATLTFSINCSHENSRKMSRAFSLGAYHVGPCHH